MQLAYFAFETPLGDVVVVANKVGIVAVSLSGNRERHAVVTGLARSLGGALVPSETGLIRKAERQLRAYLEGKREGFDLPLAISGSAFARRVWASISRIPYASTMGYGELARFMGRPEATRAVANACGANPVPIIVPCHRVIAADGGLGGFSAGLAVKRRLLAIERGSGRGLPLFGVADREDRAQARSDDGQAALEELEPGLRSWIQARLDGDLSKATAWMEAETWADRVFDALDAEAFAALTAHIVQAATTSASHASVEQAAFILLDSLTSPALLSHQASDAIWSTALRAAFALNDNPHIEKIAAQYLAHVRPSRRVYQAVSSVLERVLSGTLATTVPMRERAVDLWVEVRAAAGELPTVTEDFAAQGLWREAALQGEMDLLDGVGQRRHVLEQLAKAYEAMGDVETAVERLQTLWLETGDVVWARELRRLRDIVHGPLGDDTAHENSCEPDAIHQNTTIAESE